MQRKTQASPRLRLGALSADSAKSSLLFLKLPDVRFWHLADIPTEPSNVCFDPKRTSNITAQKSFAMSRVGRLAKREATGRNARFQG
jgi:hypothetical protein